MKLYDKLINKEESLALVGLGIMQAGICSSHCLKNWISTFLRRKDM